MKVSNVGYIVTNSINKKTYDSNALSKNLCKTDFFDKEKITKKYNNVVSFKGVDAKGKVKQRGMLMHITSLPAERSYCGQFLDPQTEQFIQWLEDAHQTHWIMNPLNALKEDLCPYSAEGRFSRNKFIVNLNKLTEKEYGNILKKSELPDDITVPMFTLDMLKKQKNPRFKRAFFRFKKLLDTIPIKKEYAKFVKENDELWLEQYAVYDVISKRYGDNWFKWDKRLQLLPEKSKEEKISLTDKMIRVLKQLNPTLKENELKDEINLYKFEQFLFNKQYNQTVEELNKKNIHLVLDLPIGVSANGVDTWGRKNIFLLGANFKPEKVSGCPPEKAYHYTQVWNHALYNYDSPEFWDYQEKALKQIIKTADLRLDHFVGYINRAEIPTSYKRDDGTVLLDEEIFYPKEKGGMGKEFFLPEWIVNINEKRSPKGESIFELFLRCAKECGKKPEETYILENFGPLARTKEYKNFDKKYGNKFISQKVPISMGIGDLSDINSPFDLDSTSNVAILTGNHDLPSLREYIDGLTSNGKNARFPKKVKEFFKKFCKSELNLTDEEMKTSEEIYKNVMKWFYTKNVKQVQTTIQDALGLYWRPNYPGKWNGSEDKYLMKPSTEGLLPIWSKVFPKNFLSRENHSGICPGYKSKAQAFIEMINNLYNK